MVYHLFTIRKFKGVTKCYILYLVFCAHNAITVSYNISKQRNTVCSYRNCWGCCCSLPCIEEKPIKKFVELNKMTGEFVFVDGVGSNPQSIYVPVVRLVKSTLMFPIDNQEHP